VAICRIEPALARRDLNMLLLPVHLHAFLSAAASVATRSGPWIASHSFAMTFINNSSLNATWYNYPTRNFKKMLLLPESCTNYLLRLEALCLKSSFHDLDPHHMGNLPAGQNYSNFALNTRLSAPRYDTWCKIQLLIWFFWK
jgi:hypothetical protein